MQRCAAIASQRVDSRTVLNKQFGDVSVPHKCCQGEQRCLILRFPGVRVGTVG